MSRQIQWFPARTYVFCAHIVFTIGIRMAHWQKSPGNFTPLGTSLEAEFHRLESVLTPAEQFFVCNAGDSVVVDPASYRLKIKGDAVERVVTLGLDDLKALPQHTITAVVECAGNQRTLFEKVDGISISRDSQGDDVKWTLGGVGMAEWTGPRLADVLALAGVQPKAKWVAPMGLDVLNPECDIEIPLPVEKALAPETILGLKMNGAPLPIDHGAPVRMVVPGWVGTYWVKWVGWLTVSSREIRNYRTDEYYVMDGKTVTEQNIKSSLCLPFPAALSADQHQITGFARSSGQPIERVEWKVDDEPWSKAELLSEPLQWGWVRFGFSWKGEVGAHTIRTRAWDKLGRTQPEKAKMNPGSLLYNGIIPHPITVR
ncbi:molybdopterin-dependent oxidoreductase [Lutimaribacter marinistellae]|uniref:Molybdopterin-dependent oxidoreductase n=1 Tax=Lutimaribacter marinistellae TaxID=1820329 RepID=A0ABV7TQQ5_9RHOB